MKGVGIASPKRNPGDVSPVVMRSRDHDWRFPRPSDLTRSRIHRPLTCAPHASHPFPQQLKKHSPGHPLPQAGGSLFFRRYLTTDFTDETDNAEAYLRRLGVSKRRN